MEAGTLIYALGMGGAFLLFLAALRHYAQRSPFPPESWLVISGVAYALLQQNLFPGLPAAVLSADTVLILLLPILIFASGRSLPAGTLRREWRAISLFALPGVVLSMLIIGLPLAGVMGLPWSHGLMFGAAVAATDPSAVGVIFRRFGLPERLETLIEGESLFNDGIAIVLFGATTALALGEAMVGVGDLTLRLLWSLAAAIPLGLLLGWAMGKLVAVWHEQNRFSGLSLTLILCYGSFLLAEHLLHLSGVITVLCAALAFRHSRCGHPPAAHAHDSFEAFWDYLNTLAAGVLFFALGSAVGHHAFFINWVVPLVVILLLLSRAVLVYGGGWLLNRTGSPVPPDWQPVLLLGGLRGAVSAALVLLIPPDYPHRIELLCLVFVLIMFTLLVHPPLLQRRLRRATLNDGL
ncbi:MAG: sodium:proton antiporter [Gammaproteobacteria bacterium]|nr:sodium:proton antiporter [Gammaproteobacteria bacterium]